MNDAWNVPRCTSWPAHRRASETTATASRRDRGERARCAGPAGGRRPGPDRGGRRRYRGGTTRYRRWGLAGWMFLTAVATSLPAADPPAAASPAIGPSAIAGEPVAVGATAGGATAGGATDAEIALLIEDLGDDSYATRARAKERLQRFGLEAFDDLHLAQFHPDNEIAMAARFLVSSLMVRWSADTDSPQVREVLSEYGAQDESERHNRIDMLSELSAHQGLVALARLARFEPSLRLSRMAALAAMRPPMNDDPVDRKRDAERVLQTLGDSERQSAEWLRTYAHDLIHGAYSADRWRRLIDRQRDLVDASATDASSRASVLELVRVCASRAAQAGLRDEAISLAAAHIDLIEPTTRDLVEACTWAVDHQLHPFILALQTQHPRMFAEHPMLLYGAAEAEVAAGNEARAERLAEQASQIRPLPSDPKQLAELEPKQIEELAQAHRTIAGSLRERGLFQWAQREYRLVIDALEVDSLPAAVARRDLANMLAELQQFQGVVDVLTPLADRMQRDEKLKQRMNNVLIASGQIQSHIDYHRALQLIAAGDAVAAQPLLQRAYRAFPENIDILITMYRLEGDQPWRQQVGEQLHEAIRRYRLMAQQAKLRLRQLGPAANPAVAEIYNQYAWLVSNTEGNYQEALDYSLKSLEFDADAESRGARLDTCARCYFAVGELDQAVATQQRALKYLPHSPSLQRQLQEFQAAAAAADPAEPGENGL